MLRHVLVYVVVIVLLGVFPTNGFSQAIPVDRAGLDQFRRDVLRTRGDIERGRLLLEDNKKSKCLTCHSIQGRGSTLGPELSGVGGGRLTRNELLEAILEPSTKIHPDYASMTYTLKTGKSVVGLLRKVEKGELEIATSGTESTRIKEAEIEDQSRSRVSIMPDGLHKVLSAQEIADLISYIESLKPPVGSLREAIDSREISVAAGAIAFTPIGPASATFHRPVWYASLPGHPSKSIVIEMQRAKIWVIDESTHERELFVDLVDETTPSDLTGLMCIAFHPKFLENRRYFVKIHSPTSAGPLAVRVLERHATGDGLRDAGVESKVVIHIPVFDRIHNGGQLAFGPDGYLYVGMGDTGPQGDPRGHGQDLSTLLGKMIRLDIDHPSENLLYSIPPDNPFRDRDGARPEIWALGLREPWRFSFDTRTGQLWVGDVGQGLYEEVAILRAGENHGWNVIEGFQPFSDQHARVGAKYTPPVFAYHHRVGPSVTGGYVYRGQRIPSLRGKYVFGDYETRRVWALEADDRSLKSIIEIGVSPERIASFGVDRDGELFVVGFDRGQIYKIESGQLDLTPLEFYDIVPTSRRQHQSWRMTLERPTGKWFESDFDDSNWREAPGGFGRPDTPGAVIGTEWRTSDIWLRREVTLEDCDPNQLSLSLHHDEDVEVYLNGKLATKAGGFTSDYQRIAISDECRSALRSGKLLIAVHCHQTTGGQFIDVGLVEARRKKP